MNLTELGFNIEYRTRAGKKVVFSESFTADSLDKWGCKYWICDKSGYSRCSDGPNIGKVWSGVVGVSLDPDLDVVGLWKEEPEQLNLFED